MRYQHNAGQGITLRATEVTKQLTLAHHVPKANLARHFQKNARIARRAIYAMEKQTEVTRPITRCTMGKSVLKGSIVQKGHTRQLLVLLGLTMRIVVHQQTLNASLVPLTLLTILKVSQDVNLVVPMLGQAKVHPLANVKESTEHSNLLINPADVRVASTTLMQPQINHRAKRAVLETALAKSLTDAKDLTLLDLQLAPVSA